MSHASVNDGSLNLIGHDRPSFAANPPQGPVRCNPCVRQSKGVPTANPLGIVSTRVAPHAARARGEKALRRLSGRRGA